MSRKLSPSGLKLLKSLEGLKLHAYADVGGIVTIGYGHVDNTLKLSDTITEEKAEELLLKDVKRFEEGVDSAVKVQLNDNQFSALVIFAYNIGLRAFKDSTCLSNVNRGYHGDMVTHEMKRWNKVGGKVIQGLANRREKEVALWLLPPQQH